MFFNDTIIAPITSQNGGSVGIIRLSGKDAIQVSSLFFSNKSLENTNGGSFYYGKLIDEKGILIDEVVITVFKSPHSYTGEDVVEINHHNNIFIVNEILSLFQRQKIKFANPGEFTLRAFLNGKIDLLQAEAISDLINAQTKQATKNSLRKLSKELSSKIDFIRDELINVTSQLELEIDFSEEEIVFVSRDEVFIRLSVLQTEINHLTKSYRHGLELQDGLTIALVGDTNVGKSSIMNMLLGTSRSIVSDEPGTTRDYITENIFIDDFKIKLIDTAGLRDTINQIELDGISRTKAIIETTNYVLIIIDISAKESDQEFKMIETLINKDIENTILIGNKSDIFINNTKLDFIKSTKLPFLLTSIYQPESIREVKKLISKTIKFGISEESILITNEREMLLLERVEQIIKRILDCKIETLNTEFLIEDIKEIINNLEYLTGRITSDDILNNIFNKFCIGK